MRINWNEPRFDIRELEEIKKVIEANYVNEGPKTRELEEIIRNYLGVKHVIITANATAALFLAIKADSIIKGVSDFEVIVPDMTMIATATAVDWAGGKVSLIDIEKDRLTLNVGEIEKKINSKTIAIIPVHVLGRAANMKEIQKIADKFNLTIIEDAAGALGSKSEGKFLGTLGKVGCYSLQSNKIITSGQGGIIVTNDDKYGEIIRRLRDFGRASNKEFIHNAIGYNLKFNDLAAALAIAQFEKIELRKKLLYSQYELYKRELKIPQIKFFNYFDGEVPLWIDAVCENRNGLVEYLKKNEIFGRECWPAIHRNPPFQSKGSDSNFPISSFASDNVFWLPNGPALNEEKIKFICNNIRRFYNENSL